MTQPTPTTGATMTDLVTTSSMTREQATALTATIRSSFEAGLQGLALALEQGAWAAMGYGSPVEWFEAEFGDLRMVRLDRPTFKALAGAYVAEGHSTRTAAEKLGVSASAVSAATRDVERPAKTKSRDGRERSTGHLRVVAEPQVVEAEVEHVRAEPTQARRSATDVALEMVAQAGARGLTVKELCTATGWHHGQASGALSRLRKRRHVVAGDHRRLDCAAWVLRTP